jgi:hypothetical protein
MTCRHTQAALSPHPGDALVPFQAAVERLDKVFLPHASGRRRRRHQHGDAALLSDPPYPGFVPIGPLLKDGWFDAVDADHLLEEIDQVLGALQAVDIAVDDDAIPAGVDELDSGTQQHQQSFHGTTLLSWDE